MFFSTKHLFVLATVASSVLGYVVTPERNSGRGLETFTPQSIRLHPRGSVHSTQGNTIPPIKTTEEECKKKKTKCLNDAASKMKGFRTRAEEKCELEYQECLGRVGEVGGQLPTVADTSEEETNECGICLEKLGSGETTYKKNCPHTFHNECIEKWFDTQKDKTATEVILKCPTCGTVHSKFNRYGNAGSLTSY